jgi:hypothetical protein
MAVDLTVLAWALQARALLATGLVIKSYWTGS